MGIGFGFSEINTAIFEERVAAVLEGLNVEADLALQLLADKTVAAMQAAAPVSDLPQDVPDELRDGISAGPLEPGPSGASVTISSTAPYSSFVEFGTSKMPPEPFFRPALLQAKIEAP